MRPSPPTPFPTSSHPRPRKPGSVINVVGAAPGFNFQPVESASTLTFTSTSGPVSASTWAHGIASPSIGQGDNGLFLTVPAYDADEEDEEDQDPPGDQDSDQVCEDGGGGAWASSTQYHLYQYQQPHKSLDLSTQVVSLDDLDDYISDDPNMPDDAGAPLANYMDVVNLLSNGMESEDEMTPDLNTDVGIHLDHPDSSGHEDEADDDASDHDDPSQQPSPPTENLSMPPHVPMIAGLLGILSQSPPSQTASDIPDMLASAEQPGPEPLSAAALEWLDNPHPTGLTNPNPNMLGPGNHGLTDFLYRWARQSRPMPNMIRQVGRFPWPNKINALSSKEVTQFSYHDLDGDFCDMQGIDWDDLGVTRREARKRRFLTYKNYVNNEGSDVWRVSAPIPFVADDT